MSALPPPEASTPYCIFCAIVAGVAEASVVYEDEVVVVFMDLNPVTPGHLLVVPRTHAVGLEDLDESSAGHVWAVAHRMAKALRRSGLRCEGINVFLADGEVAFQEIFHFHLHVFPRYAGDGFTIGANWAGRSRDLLDADAEAIKGAAASVPPAMENADRVEGAMPPVAGARSRQRGSRPGPE
jgi:histidine triad (HIT) family protein